MKKAEVESFIKSFLLFFFSQTLLVGALFFLNYQKELHTLDEQIFSQMRVCSYTLSCQEFHIDFVPKQGKESYKLYKEPDAISGYFTIPGSQKNYLKLYLPQQQYHAKIVVLQETLLFSFVIVVMVIALLSALFSLYTLAPLKNALHLTEEFIKDILHDFNTPLATLRLNSAMLKEKYAHEKKLQRIENAIVTILNLQENLKHYLNNTTLQKEKIELGGLLQERMALIEQNYKTISFESSVEDVIIYTNKEAFVRIVDNLLSNAAKYNKPNGKVMLYIQQNHFLVMEDTGKGIENTKRVFERFYKEQDRGVGIGLHIVKKLCDELGIFITLESKVGEGSRFILNIAALIEKI